MEEMHEQPHLTMEPDFDPSKPEVQVFIRNEEEPTPLYEEEAEEERAAVRAHDVAGAGASAAAAAR